MRSIKLSTILFTVLMISANVSAGGGLTTAKYAGEFLSLGVGARSLGMGGAYVSVARDVTAGYWNPAGLSFIEYPQVMLMHTSQFSGVVSYNYGSFGIPVGHKSSLGFSIIRVGVDNIKQTALPNPDLEVGATYRDGEGRLVRNTPFVKNLFASTDYGLFLTYSKRVSESFAYGGNVKLLNRSIGDNSAWGVGFDLGFMFNPLAQLIVGINVQDITSTVLAWDTGRRELITPTIRTGLSYPLALSFVGGQVQPSMDFIVKFENRQQSATTNLGRASLDVTFGWEYQYQQSFAIRVGATEVGRFAAGAGLHFPKLQIDYAFLDHGLGATHRISARLTIEEPKFKRK
ncbi:MAG: PorV/PorQ family protein [bacterium]